MLIMIDWWIKHGEVIKSFLTYLNSKTDYFILKGDTALLLCYALDRFSEDIDLDGMSSKIISINSYVKEFCTLQGYSYIVKKDTNTVKRCTIDYGGSKKLKVEVSYRNNNIPVDNNLILYGIRVYNIDKIARLKAYACCGRSKLRDVYDISFIINKYLGYLDVRTIEDVKNVFNETLTFEYIDYIVKNQTDELISSDKIYTEYMNAYSQLSRF